METSSSCLNHLFCKFFFHLPCPSICHWGNTWYRKNILAWLNILLSGLCNSVVSSGEIQSKGLVKTNIYWYLFLRSFDNLIVQSANIIWQSIYQNYRGNVKKKNVDWETWIQCVLPAKDFENSLLWVTGMEQNKVNYWL